MKKCVLCLLGIWIYFPNTLGQYYFYDANHLEPEWRLEAGLSFGIINCLTDLGGHKGNGKKWLKDVNWKNSRLGGGIFMTAVHQDLAGLRIEASLGSIHAFDSILKNDETSASSRYHRNLHFRSKLAEISALAEFHPIFLFQPHVPLLSPYVVAGIGYYKFQPEAFIDKTWIKLQPLHTEGQGFTEFPDRSEYKLQQWNLPIGIGVKYDVSRFATIRMEYIYRILGTDYLDDVSEQYIDPQLFSKYFAPDKAELARKVADRSNEIDTYHHTLPGAIRGNPKNKDAYFSFNLKASVILNRKRI